MQNFFNCSQRHFELIRQDILGYIASEHTEDAMATARGFLNCNCSPIALCHTLHACICHQWLNNALSLYIPCVCVSVYVISEMTSFQCKFTTVCVTITVSVGVTVWVWVCVQCVCEWVCVSVWSVSGVQCEIMWAGFCILVYRILICI